MDSYDLIVIGAGQGGDPLVRAFATAGKRTVLIEREDVGGSCVNYGCTPTKLLASIAATAYEVRRAGEHGVRATFDGVDWPAILARKGALIHEFRDETEKKIRDAGVDLIFEEAKFSGERQVRVGDRQLHGEVIVIDVGTRAAIPPIEGLKETGFLDNRGILDVAELPERLLILGGGPIAVEFAQMFRRFGSEVVLVERSSRLLPQEDEDVAGCISEVLSGEGVEVVCGNEVARVEAGPTLVLADGRRFSGSHLLVATGRTPNTEALDLGKGGVEVDDDGYVAVDERLKTSADGVYAIGDVKGGPAFTHVSYDDYRILAANLLGGGSSTTKDRLIPWAVYTDPQIGHIGRTEDQLKEAGVAYRVAKLPAHGMARAHETGRLQGFLKVLVAEETDEVLGCVAVLPEGGEIATLAQVAMIGGVGARRLADSILIHPSWAEAFNTVFADLEL